MSDFGMQDYEPRSGSIQELESDARADAEIFVKSLMALPEDRRQAALECLKALIQEAQTEEPVPA